jgi:hypothetical protein
MTGFALSHRLGWKCGPLSCQSWLFMQEEELSWKVPNSGWPSDSSRGLSSHPILLQMHPTCAGSQGSCCLLRTQNPSKWRHLRAWTPFVKVQTADPCATGTPSNWALHPLWPYLPLCIIAHKWTISIYFPSSQGQG